MQNSLRLRWITFFGNLGHNLGSQNYSRSKRNYAKSVSWRIDIQLYCMYIHNCVACPLALINGISNQRRSYDSNVGDTAGQESKRFLPFFLFLFSSFPSHFLTSLLTNQLRVLEECCNLLSGVRGGSRAAKVSLVHVIPENVSGGKIWLYSSNQNIHLLIAKPAIGCQVRKLSAAVKYFDNSISFPLAPR